jgi:hypothetical protein
MKTAAGHGHTRLVLCVLVSAGVMLASAGTAWAQPPITDTDVSAFSESFSEPVPCGDELYAQTASIHLVVHFTYFPDTGALYFHEEGDGQIVAVPLDGTGPTYTSNFRFSDTESIRAVKSGDLLVEQDTDFQHTVLRGSDGSRALVTFHAHFTVNANGDATVEFLTDSLVCT